MTVICLDMEGMLTPENWIAFADKVGIPHFNYTTTREVFKIDKGFARWSV